MFYLLLHQLQRNWSALHCQVITNWLRVDQVCASTAVCGPHGTPSYGDGSSHPRTSFECMTSCTNGYTGPLCQYRKYHCRSVLIVYLMVVKDRSWTLSLIEMLFVMSCVQQNHTFIAYDETQKFIKDSFASAKENRIIKIKVDTWILFFQKIGFDVFSRLWGCDTK